MSSEYRPPSSRRGFIAFGFALGLMGLATLLALMFYSGMFMHGDPQEDR